jgi:hypothetical protein
MAPVTLTPSESLGHLWPFEYSPQAPCRLKPAIRPLLLSSRLTTAKKVMRGIAVPHGSFKLINRQTKKPCNSSPPRLDIVADAISHYAGLIANGRLGNFHGPD